MKINALKSAQTLITVVLLLAIGAFAGYYFGVTGYEVELKSNVKEVEVINKTPEIPSTVDFSKFWIVWDDVNANHIKRPLNPEDLLNGAIEGMVSGIGDPYTTYLNIENNKAAKDSLNGKYEGIGAQLGMDENNRLMIAAPLEGSPAMAAGVLAGDLIIEIEGEDTSGISIAEAVSKIRGDAGTPIVLTMYRKSWDAPKEITIVRDQIRIESVTWEDKGDGIAYIRLNRFGESTNKDWSKVANEINYQMPNLNGIILDVRSNPGGYLDSAVYIASEFIPKGIIVTEDFSDGSSHEFKVVREGLFTDKDLPLVVVIDRGSASASEIVGAALKEKRDAQVVGTRSFGKGSVQKSEEYGDGSALHVTIAKWLTPDKNWLDAANSEFPDSVYNEVDENDKEIVGGLKPDHFVELQEGDALRENDSQVLKAINVLREASNLEPLELESIETAAEMDSDSNPDSNEGETNENGE